MKRFILNIMLIFSFIGTFIIFPYMVVDIWQTRNLCKQHIEQIKAADRYYRENFINHKF